MRVLEAWLETSWELARRAKGAPVTAAIWRPAARRWWLTAFLTMLAVTVVVVEVRTSWLQSLVFSAAAQRMTYKVADGKGVPLASPGAGPYDQRLGYASLPKYLDRLHARGYTVTSYAQSSPWMTKAVKYGLFPAYREKDQAGLQLLDDRGLPLFTAALPERGYRDFSSIPPVIWNSLLLIENREILDSATPFRNPAVEWDRLANAFLDYGARKISRSHSQSGGSTLATQLEKLRHSPEGRTASLRDKLQQMTSASLRAYQGGGNTMPSRRDIVCEYLNSLPLAAAPGYGEVNGLGDGLYAWFGADFERVNYLLSLPEDKVTDEATRQERAVAYRQVLSLLLSVKKPAAFLQQDRDSLAQRVDAFLPLLARRGIIAEPLRDLTLHAPMVFQERAGASRQLFADRKSVDGVRVRLMGLLGVNSTYDLDRLDLTVNTTLDQQASNKVTETLRSLNDPNVAAQSGLYGEHLLSSWNKEPVIYSFTLYERGNGVNLLRVETDNYDSPLQINEGTRLELGSTAKLRTLVTYLQIVAELHAKPPSSPSQDDALSLWAVDYLKTATDRSLTAMLQAAMERKYSASPGEAFFTGGGVHTFVNFQKEDNGRILTVRESLQRSVNLVFIRMMRDIVNYQIAQRPGVRALLEDEGDPARQQYLAKFADAEGREFMTRFYKKQAGLSPDGALDAMANEPGMTAKRLAVIYRAVRPEAPVTDLAAFLARFPESKATNEDDIDTMYSKYDTKKFDWNDLGYLARIHPLELWLLRYRFAHPEASLKHALAASINERQDVYRWLFRPNRTHAQNMRIRTLIEQGAFEEIRDRWARLGYPFARMAPSYASAIGSSGDNPAALATLAGIIVNGGVRYPSARLERLHFAAKTPMEVSLERQPAKGEQVLAPEIAHLVAKEIQGVVEFGTARRAFNSVKLANGQVLAVGGKTGTGDNRFQTYGRHGWVTSSRVVNRTAAFVFTIGDRYFGTVVAYVPGSEAAGYSFTSALPVQVFKTLVPSIMPVIDPVPEQVTKAPLSTKL